MWVGGCSERCILRPLSSITPGALVSVPQDKATVRLSRNPSPRLENPLRLEARHEGGAGHNCGKGKQDRIRRQAGNGLELLPTHHGFRARGRHALCCSSALVVIQSIEFAQRVER